MGQSQIQPKLWWREGKPRTFTINEKWNFSNDSIFFKNKFTLIPENISDSITTIIINHEESKDNLPEKSEIYYLDHRKYLKNLSYTFIVDNKGLIKPEGLNKIQSDFNKYFDIPKDAINDDDFLIMINNSFLGIFNVEKETDYVKDEITDIEPFKYDKKLNREGFLPLFEAKKIRKFQTKNTQNYERNLTVSTNFFGQYGLTTFYLNKFVIYDSLNNFSSLKIYSINKPEVFSSNDYSDYTNEYKVNWCDTCVMKNEPIQITPQKWWDIKDTTMFTLALSAQKGKFLEYNVKVCKDKLNDLVFTIIPNETLFVSNDIDSILPFELFKVKLAINKEGEIYKILNYRNIIEKLIQNKLTKRKENYFLNDYNYSNRVTDSILYYKIMEIYQGIFYNGKIYKSQEFFEKHLPTPKYISSLKKTAIVEKFDNSYKVFELSKMEQSVFPHALIYKRSEYEFDSSLNFNSNITYNDVYSYKDTNFIKSDFYIVETKVVKN